MSNTHRKRRQPHLAGQPVPDRVARWLSILTLAFSVASSIGGYFYVTRVQQTLDHQKFLQSSVGFLTSLKPVALVSCYNTVKPDGGLANVVVAQNTGANVFRISKVTRQLRGANDDLPLAPAKEVVPTAVNGMTMDISPGQSTVSSEVYGKHGGYRDWSEVQVNAEIEISTSETLLNYARGVLGNAAESADLENFGKTMIRCRGSTEPVGTGTAMSAALGRR